jgi:hypothetical protein
MTLVNKGPGDVFSSNLKKCKGPQSFEECQKKNTDTHTHTHTHTHTQTTVEYLGMLQEVTTFLQNEYGS